MILLAIALLHRSLTLTPPELVSRSACSTGRFTHSPFQLIFIFSGARISVPDRSPSQGLGRNRKTRPQPHQSLLLVTSHFLGYTLGYTKLLGGWRLRTTDKTDPTGSNYGPWKCAGSRRSAIEFSWLADACGDPRLRRKLRSRSRRRRREPLHARKREASTTMEKAWEGWRLARVIKMVGGKLRAPVFQHIHSRLSRMCDINSASGSTAMLKPSRAASTCVGEVDRRAIFEGARAFAQKRKPVWQGR